MGLFSWFLSEHVHYWWTEKLLFLFGFFFWVFLTKLEFELMALCSLESPPAHFALVILEMGSHKLFAWVGLELWSTQSQPPK
jgi:hypothetical protein